jgi:formylglycine-generating enzyme required for sulfatase activity
VDFCDAEAFCRWNGKHLCHDLSNLGVGGPRGYTREWKTACRNDLSTIYPWGDETDESRCQTGQDVNGCKDNHCGPAPVGAHPRCSTSTGVLDLIGNVGEWAYACNTLDPQDPTCLVRGGDYSTLQKPCDSEEAVSNRARRANLGFRCCADLSVGEKITMDSTSGGT